MAATSAKTASSRISALRPASDRAITSSNVAMLVTACPLPAVATVWRISAIVPAVSVGAFATRIRPRASCGRIFGNLSHGEVHLGRTTSRTASSSPQCLT